MTKNQTSRDTAITVTRTVTRFASVLDATTIPCTTGMMMSDFYSERDRLIENETYEDP